MVVSNEPDDYDGINFYRGILYMLPAALTFWALFFMAMCTRQI
jgi:hypothetical protein